MKRILDRLLGRKKQKVAYVKAPYAVYRSKGHGDVFWSAGGEYNPDWYDVLQECKSADEAQKAWAIHCPFSSGKLF